VHFILVSANDDKAHFLEGMKAGADDYITKPFDLEALGARLEAAGRIVAANRRLETTAAQLRKQSARNLRAARTDPLTSVPNRLELAEDLKAMAARALRYDHQYTAAMCDVDDFKAYNDHFGHVSGDDALRRIACAIRAQLRTGDGLYRYGGEEFFLVFPEQSIIEARIGMKRILCEIERLDLHHAPAAHHSVLTISAGIAQLRPNGPGCIEDWLRRADAALYLAKAAGRNRVEVEETSS
jgi:two-component system chemotaxis response regulator CheY